MTEGKYNEIAMLSSYVGANEVRHINKKARPTFKNKNGNC